MQILQELAAVNGPLCVGLDTDPSYLPEQLMKNFGSAAEAVLTYNKEIIRRIASDKSACCCKVQIAYYESMGIEGMKIYAETLRAVKEAGLVVISDIKRGDIANTATGSVKLVSKAVVWGFLALGVYFVGKGILEFRKAGDPQHASQFSAGGSAAKVAVGGLLVALGTLIGYVSGTFGLDPSGLVGSDLMPGGGAGGSGG